MGDILNWKNKFSRHKFNTPLIFENYAQLHTHAKYFKEYINTLQTHDIPILQSGRNTGFLELIVYLRNIFSLFDCLKTFRTYLLTYKLSQDLKRILVL